MKLLYKTLKPIASNGYINILDIQYGIVDRVLTDNGRYKKLYYKGDECYFIQNKVKYYLNTEFFKL